MKINKKILIFWLATIFPLLNLSPVFAELDSSTLDFYSQNNILIYDPTAGCDDSNNTRCTPASSDQITWIGDSYSGIGKTEVQAKFPNADFGPEPYNSANSFVMSCKYIDNNEGCGEYNPSGLKILEDLVNGKYEGHTLRPYLVFALGTNTTDSSKEKMQEHIDSIMNLVGNSTQVIFVTAYTANANNYLYDTQNEALKEAATNNPNIHVADWAAIAEDSYYADDSSGIHPHGHYQEWAQAIYNALPQNCSAGLLSGNTVEEKIWNYFVKADVPGISDNPSAIAGILGNFYVESGYNPFMVGANGGYHGIYMVSDAYGGLDLQKEINDAVGKDYWQFYGWWSNPGSVDQELAEAGATQNEIDIAVKVSLDYLMRSNTWQWFVEGINEVENNSGVEGAASYAELFLGIVENAFDGDGAFHDRKVANYVESKWGFHATYQGVESRRNSAVDAYTRLSSLTSAIGGNGKAESTSGFTKYELTDSQLWDLAEVAIHENNSNLTAFKNELSIMANLYEYPTRGQVSYSPISADNFVRYVRDGGWFSTSSYVDGSQTEDIDSARLEAARDILVNGNRTLPTQIVHHDWVGDIVSATNNGNSVDESGYASGVTHIHTIYQNASEYWIFYGWISGETGVGDPMGYNENDPPSSFQTSSTSPICEESSTYSGPGGQEIAEAATKMAWPVQVGQGDDEHAGMCATDSSYTNWVSYSTNASDCYNNPRQLYREQKDANGIGTAGEYRDCGWFVASIIYYLGIDDDGFPKGGTDNMMNWMSGQSEHWTEISNTPDADLKPGDIFVSDQHILVWVGEYGGEYGPWVDASLGTRVGIVNDYYSADSRGYHYGDDYWRIFRRKSSSIGDEGLTLEQAQQFMRNYGANKNNVSRDAVGAGLWAIGTPSNCGSNCSTFSAFFINKFSDINVGSTPGNGEEVADTVKAAYGRSSTDSEPSVWSVFSWSDGSYGHTGIILGHHDGKWIVGHSSYSYTGCGEGTGGDGTWGNRGGGSGFVVESSDIDTAIGASGGRFSKLNVDTSKIQKFLETGE